MISIKFKKSYQNLNKFYSPGFIWIQFFPFGFVWFFAASFSLSIIRNRCLLSFGKRYFACSPFSHPSKHLWVKARSCRKFINFQLPNRIAYCVNHSPRFSCHVLSTPYMKLVRGFLYFFDSKTILSKSYHLI